MSLFKRDGGWVIKWKDGAGRWRQQRTNSATKAEAQELERGVARKAEFQRSGVEPMSRPLWCSRAPMDRCSRRTSTSLGCFVQPSTAPDWSTVGPISAVGAVTRRRRPPPTPGTARAGSSAGPRLKLDASGSTIYGTRRPLCSSRPALLWRSSSESSGTRLRRSRLRSTATSTSTTGATRFTGSTSSRPRHQSRKS